MNKSDVVETLASELNISCREARSIVETITATMTEALVRGEAIEIRGFGTFVVRHYGAYEGRNPKSGKKIHVKQKKLPFFKVGKELRTNVDAMDKN